MLALRSQTIEKKCRAAEVNAVIAAVDTTITSRIGRVFAPRATGNEGGINRLAQWRKLGDDRAGFSCPWMAQSFQLLALR
jgi:hypothetical protein